MIGIGMSLPQYAVRNRNSGSVPWTPSEITTALWLDAADTSTIVQSGGLVSQWSDKSGNAHHAVQATGSLQPQTGADTIGGKNALVFDDDLVTVSPNFFGASVSDAFVIVVHKVNAGGGRLFSLTGDSYPGNPSGRWQAHAPWEDGVLYFDTNTPIGEDRVSAINYALENQTLITSFYGSTSDSLQQVFRNGVLFTGDNSASSALVSGSIEIGYQFTSIAEFLVINGTVTTITRQRIEGYLAWKWGLVSLLPSNHPYKNARPTKNDPWNPAFIDTALWLDAADSSTITQSGGLVSQWSDKSGNARHATQAIAASQPAYISSSFNSLPALTFDGVNDRLLHGLTTGGASTIFVVYRLNQAQTSYRVLISIGPNNTTGSMFLARTTATVMGSYGTSDINSNHPYQINVPTISAMEDSDDSTAKNFWVNGANAGVFTANPSGQPIAHLGGIDGQACAVTIAECVVLPSVASSTTRQRIEGYLAWKWGLVANLPADHPYKTARPTV